MHDEQRLERAKQHIFLCGVGDTTEQLCRENMAFGLAKIQLVQQRLGLDDRAFFVSAPDATVTRNRRRWAHGFGYGGVLRSSPELAVLESLPNGCGMLVGSADRPRAEAEVRAAARRARLEPLTLEGIELQYDLADSNHFVDACALERVLPDGASEQLPDRIFVIHSSGHEHRASSPWGPGLYLHRSASLQSHAERHDTPWGPLHVLRGDDAVEYHRFCQRVQDFNARRRELFAEHLFGPHATLCNATHQGIRRPGWFHLGSYWFSSASSDRAGLFPLTLGPDQPLFLLRPRPNFSAAAIDALGWRDRAEALDLHAELQRADLLPHGGGYAYPDFDSLLRIEDHGPTRTFIIERTDGAELRVESIRDHPFAYRGLAVLHKTVQLGLAEPVARYSVEYVIKE